MNVYFSQGGSIEFMNECTTIDEPFCLYDADRNKDKKTFRVTFPPKIEKDDKFTNFLNIFCPKI